MKWLTIFVGLYLLSSGFLTAKAQEPEIQVHLVFETQFEGIGTSIAWHPSGDYFVAGIDATLYFFNPSETEPFYEINLPGAYPIVIGGLAWSPDGTRLAILWGGSLQMIQYSIWILDNITKEITLEISDAVLTIHWSPNSELLAGIQIYQERPREESTFIVWDSQTGLMFSQYHPEEYAPPHEEAVGDSPAALVWMSDSQILTASYRAKLGIIDLESNEFTLLEQKPDLSGEQAVGNLGNGFDRMGDLQLIDWRATDNLLAFGATFFYTINEYEINIWDLNQGQLAAKLIGHTLIVTSVEWHPTENLLASGSMDKTLRIWDTAAYQELASLPHDDFVTSIGWSPQGNQIASVSANGTVYLWDVTSDR